MFNHIRTLLLNEPTSNNRELSFPGEEMVPDGYVPVKLDGPLKSAYTVLFGSNPDRAYKNYRLRQYLTIVHNSQMKDHLTTIDKRITYWPHDGSIDKGCIPRFGNTVRNVRGSAVLEVLGGHVSDDANGRLLWHGTVSIEFSGNKFSPHLASIASMAPVSETVSHQISLTDGISTGLDVPGSAASFVVRWTGSGSSTIEVHMLARPSRGISVVLSGLESLLGKRAEGMVADALFGKKLEEPYQTYLNLWRDGPSQLRLAAVVMALAFRIEERR